MTHDELLKEIDVNCWVNPKPLLKVVMMHKPQEITLPDGSWGQNCYHCDGFNYPCATIKVIEWEVSHG